MSTLSLYDRIYGGLLGGAVGDALGVPMECLHYQDARRIYGDYRGFQDIGPEQVANYRETRGKDELLGDIGYITDDTVLADLLLDCILEHDGHITAHVFAKAWERFEEIITLADGRQYPRIAMVHWIERITFYRNKLKAIPKRELGHGEANATNAIMYIAPVGLLCAGDPLLAELMAVDITAVNQHGRSRDVAGGYAAALAACFVPDTSVDEIVEVAIRHTGDIDQHVRELRAMVDLARDCATCDEYIERHYVEIIGPVLPMRDPQSYGSRSCVTWNSAEVLGPTLAAFIITRGEDPAAMMLMCAMIGRDADTICRCAGGLIGAYRGAQAIPEDWAAFVLARNPWLRLEAKAEALTDIVRRRLAARLCASQAVLGADQAAHVWSRGHDSLSRH